MWFVKCFIKSMNTMVAVEAKTPSEAEKNLKKWMENSKNLELLDKTLKKNTEESNSWSPFPDHDTPEDADIIIPKDEEELESAKCSQKIDLSIYFFENRKNKLAINGRKYYSDIDAERFLELIRDWSKNFSMKLVKCIEKSGKNHGERPILRFIAVQKDNFLDKIDDFEEKIVEVETKNG